MSKDRTHPQFIPAPCALPTPRPPKNGTTADNLHPTKVHRSAMQLLSDAEHAILAHLRFSK